MNMEKTAGVDEVGRGCLAGPVVACAVILPVGYNNSELIDSKKISAKKREKLSKIIYQDAVAIGIGTVCNTIIDSIGIVPATKQAMHLAIRRLNTACDLIIVDAVSLANLPCPTIHPNKAEDQYQCVAAASIVAKVYRDALMYRLHSLYPDYMWDKNKGYGTQKHIEAIQTVGATELHRVSFIKSFV